MRVKKFEAKSMKDALQLVKTEMGPDAVILAARDNRKNFGIAGGASVEVTAAVSESTLQKKKFVESRLSQTVREKFQATDARTQRKIIDKMVDSRARDQERIESREAAGRRPITQMSYIDIPDDEFEGSTRRRAALDRASGRNVADLLDDFDQDFKMIEPGQKLPGSVRRTNSQEPPHRQDSSRRQEPPRRQDSARVAVREVAREPEQRQAPESEPRESEIIHLKDEILRLQKMVDGFQKVPQQFVQMHPGADYGISYDQSFMFQKLVEAGVTIDHTVEILQVAAKEIDTIQMKKRPIVDAWVARWLLGNIHIAPNPMQGRLHLFVGGAGSGKTSTLVKMASHLVVQGRKKVAILTTDSFKVGAVDQLKIYCQILNVPFAVLRSRKDWEWVLGQLSGVDHVLVDFPGFQLRDLDEIHLLKSLLPPEGTVPVTHFCVAATSKDGDAFEIARRYRVADYQDLIFTNLDQSVQHGIIYNLQKKSGKPLHSFGTGNRIPEDFELATKERVLDLIFKLTKLKREMR
jgi:flagellar biosynthesis protein FlhF